MLSRLVEFTLCEKNHNAHILFTYRTRILNPNRPFLVVRGYSLEPVHSSLSLQIAYERKDRRRLHRNYHSDPGHSLSAGKDVQGGQ